MSSPRTPPAGGRGAGVGSVTAAALVAGVLLAGGGARASALTTVDLAFEVEPDLRGACPDAESFRASVRRQLGYDPFASGADRTVAVSIAHKANGFAGRIHWSDASGHWTGERRLSSRKPDCASIAQDLAFSVAVQVQLLATMAPVENKASAAAGENPSVASGAPPPRRDGAVPSAASALSPPPPPAEARAPVSDPLASQRPPPSRAETASASAQANAIVASASSPASPMQTSSSSGFSLSAGLGPAAAFGLAPRSTPMGRLFVDLQWARRISLELAVDGAWPITLEVPKSGGFELKRTSGAAAGCGHRRPFIACLLGTVGVLQARGIGVDVASSPTGVFYQLGARLGARFDLGSRYFAGARVDGLWFPAPWTVEVNGVPMWTTPRLSALVGVDVGVIFF